MPTDPTLVDAGKNPAGDTLQEIDRLLSGFSAALAATAKMAATDPEVAKAIDRGFFPLGAVALAFGVELENKDEPHSGARGLASLTASGAAYIASPTLGRPAF